VTLRLWTAARQTRDFLEPHWPSWHVARGLDPPVVSQWTCSRSSLLLRTVLRRDFGIKAIWVTGCPFDASGAPLAAGFRHGDEWMGHSWVEAEGQIIDITADQFGHAPIRIVPASHPDYVRSRDYAFAHAKRRRVETLRQLWPLWQMMTIRRTVSPSFE
jgi:hypothetical protein